MNEDEIRADERRKVCSEEGHRRKLLERLEHMDAWRCLRCNTAPWEQPKALTLDEVQTLGDYLKPFRHGSDLLTKVLDAMRADGNDQLADKVWRHFGTPPSNYTKGAR